MTRKHTKEGLPTFAEFSKRLRYGQHEGCCKVCSEEEAEDLRRHDR